MATTPALRQRLSTALLRAPRGILIASYRTSLVAPHHLEGFWRLEVVGGGRCLNRRRPLQTDRCGGVVAKQAA
jgi:hypothetical protein